MSRISIYNEVQQLSHCVIEKSRYVVGINISGNEFMSHTLDLKNILCFSLRIWINGMCIVFQSYLYISIMSTSNTTIFYM